MDALGELLGQSPAIESVRETIRRLLSRQQPARRLPAVLIQGETGTGKGVVARLIHRLGPRARGPFVDVNCAAIPETLIEAELFGFERGAFTDARRAKPGLFQTAHRGTIFLDEIGLLPEPLQAKLLTVIEEQAVRRLGSTQSEPADAWIISATNADLQAAIKERQFREDLYHRLAVLTLRLPPLRERGGDVLLLAEHFLGRVCADYGLPAKTLAPDARGYLMAYPWPGNVRELSNVIERAALLAEGPTVTADQLELRGGPTAAAPAARPAPAPVSMDDAMREHLRATLEQTGWNISRTAALLRISRNTLRARIDKLNLRGGPEGAAPRRGERAPDAGPAVTAAPLPASPSEPAPAPTPPPARTSLPPIRWERRRVTVMRASLILPEDMDEFPDTSRALEVVVDKVRTFGGRIEELGTTGLDASFGLEPIEDAPRRAANAAMAILKAAEKAHGGNTEPLRVKIAMHTSPYMVGQISGAPQIDQNAKRQTWAILDALVASAEPNSAVVSPATVPFLDRRFELAPAGAPAGAAGQRYRLVGREPAGLGPWARISKFVGRRSELELLRNRWASALGGHGQLVGVVGEPGVGKSRLLWEFTHSHGGGSLLLLETASVALGTPTPYLPIIDLLKRYFQLDTGEDTDRVRGKIADRLRGLDESLTPSLPALLVLLDLRVSDAQWDGLNPAQRRQRTFDAVKRLLLRESRRQPLLLVFEDAHWIDAETQALLDALVEGLPTAHVLFLLSYRPEYQHGWGGKSFYTQLRVDPLPPESAEELLHNLLGEHASLLLLKPRLIEWTEGNPFFLEESVRTLVETQALVGDRGDYRLAKPVTSIQVPATVEEVLAARVDRLAAEQRRLLQSAAVIGRYVPYPVLAAIADVPEEALGESLRQLQAAEFLYETGSFPDHEYTFKHALTHEVAYASVAQGKRTLHARILEVMETLYADRLVEHVDRLADHAFRGHVWDKALAHLRWAGLRALGRSANREAAAFFEQALDALERLPESQEVHEQAIDLRIDLRNALTLLGEPQRMLEHLRQAAVLAEGAGDQRRLGRVLSFEANCLILLGEHERAIDSGRRALAIAESLDDFALKTASRQYVGRAYESLGDYRRAIELFSGIVGSLTGELIHEHFGLPVIPAVFSRSHLAACLAEVGHFDEATHHAEDAVRLAESTDHADTLLWAYRATGLVHIGRGNGERAAAALERALSLCHTRDMPTYVARVSAELGLAHAMCGHAGEGVPLAEQALENALAMKQSANLPGITLRLGEVNFLAGRLAEAADSAKRVLQLLDHQRERGNEAHALGLLGDVAWRRDPADFEVAERAYGQALALADALGMRPLAARCRLGLGLMCARRDEPSKARDHLAAAAAQLREMAMTTWLSQAEAELARLN